MKQQKGYIAITTVLLISAVVLVIVTTTALLAIGQAQSSLALYKGESTLSFVEGCMEDALFKARISPTYSGGTTTYPEGTCSILVSKVGNIWTITATTTDTAYKRTIQIIMKRSHTINISSWKEI